MGRSSPEDIDLSGDNMCDLTHSDGKVTLFLEQISRCASSAPVANPSGVPGFLSVWLEFALQVPGFSLPAELLYR